MSILNFSENIKMFIEELNSTRERESILIAQESAALARNRVQNEKQDSQGSSFGSYSEAVVPQWMLWGKSLSQGAEDRVRSGDWFQSYKDLREANNLPTDEINFTFSGSMWKNIGVVSVENTGDSTTVEVGGQTERAESILSWQSDKHGNIIELNEEERNFIGEAHLERISNLFQKYFG
jgi:hypothetical protein